MRNIKLLIILIQVGSIFTSLCNIQIFLSESQDEIISFRPQDKLLTSIELDKYYQVYCLTDEKVRSRNYISLISTNNSDTDLENKLNRKFQITNWSFNDKNLTYLKGGLIVDSKNFSMNLNYNVFCRFLPVDPSIYCEKTLKLNIITFNDKSLTTFFVILIICVLICLANLIVKSYLKKKGDNYVHRKGRINRDLKYSLRNRRNLNLKNSLRINNNGEFTNLNVPEYQVDPLGIEIPIIQEKKPITETRIITETEHCTTSVTTGITTTERLIM
ncbi:unnamed protein product [Brachionus calyciflorus]|uniref:Uncharacterized protein n=1 Tax=Brachionus calyciflorus TaxID=104777 RepID=A0A813T935_9BILA|nr:unnamed protein product [Brachionus calyciflorus]